MCLASRGLSIKFSSPMTLWAASSTLKIFWRANVNASLSFRKNFFPLSSKSQITLCTARGLSVKLQMRKWNQTG
jgi:hypothetical protein